MSIGDVGSARDDRELIEAHLGGDSSAFPELFRRHRNHVWAVCLRTVGNHEDAADATQETFLKAIRSIDSFRGDASVSTWLHRIAVNTCLDLLRSSSRRPTDALPENDAIPDRRDIYSSRETEIVVRAALAQLAEDQRIAIILIDLQGLSMSEASEILGVAEGTVKSRCARGRGRLAELLASERNLHRPRGVRSKGGEQ